MAVARHGPGGPHPAGRSAAEHGPKTGFLPREEGGHRRGRRLAKPLRAKGWPDARPANRGGRMGGAVNRGAAPMDWYAWSRGTPRRWRSPRLSPGTDGLQSTARATGASRPRCPASPRHWPWPSPPPSPWRPLPARRWGRCLGDRRGHDQAGRWPAHPDRGHRQRRDPARAGRVRGRDRNRASPEGCVEGHGRGLGGGGLSPRAKLQPDRCARPLARPGPFPASRRARPGQALAARPAEAWLVPSPAALRCGRRMGRPCRWPVVPVLKPC